MVKLFVTGDNHFCRLYSGSPVKNEIIQSRLDSLSDMVQKAETEQCDYFIITGDLFDRISNISKRDITQVVNILKDFNQLVLVLPGNHDFYTGGEKLWKDFLDCASQYGNIVLLNEYRTYHFGDGENELVVYPAYCDAKHSNRNKIGWIAEKFEQTDAFTVGIAHGTIIGISPDMNEEYFPMSINDLNAVPVDAWLIGHTHITYPFDLPYGKDLGGYRVFNAGTHEQLDIGNNTEGNSFIITLTRESGEKKVLVCKLHTGHLAYKRLNYIIVPEETKTLEQILAGLTAHIPAHTILEVRLQGTISEEDYNNRTEIYHNALDRFVFGTVDDEELVTKITLEKIKDTYSEFSLAAQFLENLMDEPVEVQMAYDLLRKSNSGIK